VNREPERIGHLGSTEIILWQSHDQPGQLDALILPEDTHLILQAVTEELDPNTTPLDLWAAIQRAADSDKHPLGSVVIANGKERGVEYIASAIVYDFEAEPISRKETVINGLDNAFTKLVERGCGTIGVFPLGTMRGGISLEEYFAAVGETVTRLGGESPRTIYLLGQAVPPADRPDA
jgi:hypothetical protein